MKCLPALKSLALVLVGFAVGDSLLASGMNPIGSKRQFFFDQSMIENLINTKHRLNAAEKYEFNPIIKKDRPWEGADITISWIYYNPEKKKFCLRYTTSEIMAVGRNEKGEIVVKGVEDGTKRVTCEAYSKDGFVWTKPNLGLVEFEGSTDNNILPDEASFVEYCFQDLHESDPQKRFKGFIREGTMEDAGMIVKLYYSPDSYHWTEFQNNPVVDTGSYVGRWGPTFFEGWDPIRETYFAHMENNFHMHSKHHRRSIGRAETKDLVTWSEPETIVVVDRDDYPDTEFYALPTSYYKGWRFGINWIFSTTNTFYTPQFVFSRDGINYDRTYRDPLIYRGDRGDFDSVVILPQAPIVFEDKVLIYYDGSNWRSPEDLLTLGSEATGAIGLAILPLDGFVSLEGARIEESIVITRPFSFEGAKLHLNLKAATQQWGAGPCEVRVEILNARHIPVPGYTYQEADVLSASGSNEVVTWNGSSDLAALEGQSVRLKISFRNAKLYAFQFK